MANIRLRAWHLTIRKRRARLHPTSAIGILTKDSGKRKDRGWATRTGTGAKCRTGYRDSLLIVTLPRFENSRNVEMTYSSNLLESVDYLRTKPWCTGGFRPELRSEPQPLQT